MKKVLLMAPLAAALLNANSLEVVVKATATKYDNAPTDNVYFHEDKSAYIKAYVKGEYYLTDYLEVYGRVGNQYEDTFIEEAGVRLSSRYNNHMFGVQVGTINMVRGIFDPSLDSDQQAPSVYMPSGVYDDRWRQGFFGSQLGAKVHYGYMLGNTLAKVSYSHSEPRITDEDKAETSVFNYVSDYADVDYGRVDTVEFELDVANTVAAFLSYTTGSLKLDDKSGMTDMEKAIWYMTSPETFDPALAFTSEEEYEYDLYRAGVTYEHIYFTAAVEGYYLQTKNDSNDYDDTNKGGYVYLNAHLPRGYTPYVIYNQSRDNDDDKLEEYTVGVRKTFGRYFALLAEYKQTDWAQTNTLAEYKELRATTPEENIDMDIYTIQLIMRY
jgi:hypothetical protein